MPEADQQAESARTAAAPVHSEEALPAGDADCSLLLNVKPIKAVTQPSFTKIASSRSSPPSPATTSLEGLEYADLSDEKVPKCLLCQRQFKSLDVLQKHSSQSELHKVSLTHW